MSIAESFFGSKPHIAPYISTEFGPEQLKALKENITAMPWITSLGNLFQTYMTDAYEKAIPGFSDILAMGGKLTEKMQATAGEELAGKIPQDVQDAVQRSSAFQNLMSGGGGAMAQANTARNLGLTSLDMISKGAELQGAAGNAAQRWAGLASNLIMSPEHFLVTPAQQVQLTMANRLHEQATQQLRENVKAAPDPGLQALNQWVEQVGGTVVASYLGGGMGGGKGGGNYKTSFNATDYLGSPGQSDVTNPGYIMEPGGDITSFNTGAPDSGVSGLNLGASGQGAAAYNPNAPDLWSSFNPTPNYNAFQFGNTAGGTSGLAAQQPWNFTGG